MNVRIQELAKRAGFENGHQDYDGRSLSDELEKFAELLINSCAQLGDYAYLGGVLYPGETIREYFGVK